MTNIPFRGCLFMSWGSMMIQKSRSPCGASAKGLMLAFHRHLLTCLLQAASLGCASHGDFQLEFSADLLAALDANQRVRDHLKSLSWNLGSTQSAVFVYGIHRASPH